MMGDPMMGDPIAVACLLASGFAILGCNQASPVAMTTRHSFNERVLQLNRRLVLGSRILCFDVFYSTSSLPYERYQPCIVAAFAACEAHEACVGLNIAGLGRITLGAHIG